MTPEQASRLAVPDDAAWGNALVEAREWQAAHLTGVALTEDHLQQLLVATPRAEGDPMNLLLRCTDVVFRDRIWFANTHVHLQLTGCRFEDEVELGGEFENTWLTNVTFARLASFSSATFIGETTFSNVRFAGGVRFDETRFTGDVSFEATSFQRHASFIGAAFEGAARFKPGLVTEQSESRAAEDVDSDHEFVLVQKGRQAPTSADTLDFGRAVFQGDAELVVEVTGDVWFIDAQVRRIYGLIIAGSVAFDGSRFADDVLLTVRAIWTSLAGGHFDRRIVLHFAGDLVADGAVFAADSTLAGPPHDSDLTARLLSVRGASVSKLTLSALDLSSCLFWRAYGLDDMRIEANCGFAGPPRTRRYTTRRTIAEENLWRGGRWHAPDFDKGVLSRVGAPAQLGPAEIASVYRALRKSTEARKDEPGAADFYYGEMEMRRHAAPPASGERLLLTLYWAVSGYALRASRALIALAAICVCLAVAMWGYGFSRSHSIGDSLIYTFGSSARVKTGLADAALTTGGEVTLIALGVVGPILYGLALFSFRGRVKR
jgi:Pentapeptide repeats (9 copies)